MTRSRALEVGSYFYEGKPCACCGGTRRYTRCFRCVACMIRQAGACGALKRLYQRAEAVALFDAADGIQPPDDAPSFEEEQRQDRAWHHSRLL